MQGHDPGRSRRCDPLDDALTGLRRDSCESFGQGGEILDDRSLTARGPITELTHPPAGVTDHRLRVADAGLAIWASSALSRRTLAGRSLSR